VFEPTSTYDPPRLPPLASPPHVYEPASTFDHPPPYLASPPHVSPYSIDPPPPPPLVSPSIDSCLSPSPHVSSSIDPSLRPLPPHVSQAFVVVETMFASITDAHLHDIDSETFDSVILLTFVFEIVVLDRGSTYGSRDIDAPSSFGGPI
jgi:hypothetical protein